MLRDNEGGGPCNVRWRGRALPALAMRAPPSRRRAPPFTPPACPTHAHCRSPGPLMRAL